MFRFCRAYGGNANDGDGLRATLRIADVDAGLALVAAMGAVPRPREGPGVVGRLPVPGRADADQPGWCDIGGDPVWLWIGRDATLEVHVQDPDDVWIVSEAAVQIAERLEVRLAAFALDPRDPPVDDWRCIAPQTHPAVFA